MWPPHCSARPAKARSWWGRGPGGVLRDAAVLEAVERPGPEGRGGLLAAWRLVDLVPGIPPVTRRLDAPMVGRTDELARLRAALERAVRYGTAYRLTVLGDAGIGKSRLAKEFAEALGPQPLWRAARALVMVSRDRHSEAERLAREAVGLAPAEMPNLRADLLMDLAGVLLSAGQRARAQPVIAEAVERYERKGNLVSAARARSFGD
jgi:ATP/maltotriose-dependent transcriptional regulator MalT